MAFPVIYSEILFPKPLIHLLSFLGFIRKIIFSLFTFLGLSDFFEPADLYNFPVNPTHLAPVNPPISAILIRDLLPVVKLSDLVSAAGIDLPENCAVCLYEFDEGGDEEIRWLKNCKHIFHRDCLDRWIDHDQKICPLCRTSFVPRDLDEEFNQRLLAAASTGSGTDEFSDDYSNIHATSAL